MVQCSGTCAVECMDREECMDCEDCTDCEDQPLLSICFKHS